MVSVTWVHDELVVSLIWDVQCIWFELNAQDRSSIEKKWWDEGTVGRLITKWYVTTIRISVPLNMRILTHKSGHKHYHLIYYSTLFMILAYSNYTCKEVLLSLRSYLWCILSNFIIINTLRFLCQSSLTIITLFFFVFIESLYKLWHT